MPRGASPKREKEYEELKEKFKKSGRYKGRETEVASRIVNKQRAEYGETKQDKQQDKEGRSPDRNLPIPHYRRMTESQLEPKLEKLPKKKLQKVEKYEEKHKNRKGIKQAIKKIKKAA